MGPALIALAAYLFHNNIAQKKADAASLSLVPVDLVVNSLTDVTLKMQIVNPSQSSFTIDSLSANIYYQNKLIGTITKNEPFTIQKTDTSTVAFKVIPQAGQAIASLITILADKNSSKVVNVIGSYKYMGLAQPINKTISLSA